MDPSHLRKFLIYDLPYGLHALYGLILMLFTISAVATAQSTATASPALNSGTYQPPRRTTEQGKAGASSTYGTAPAALGSSTHHQTTTGGATKKRTAGEKSASGKKHDTPPHRSHKKSGQNWQVPSKPAEVYAEDINAYVQNIAAYAGPRQFVQLAEMSAESQRAGKPSAYEQQRMVGSVLGAVMGGALGMLGDDPIHDMAHMSQQGQRVGVGLGTANAYPMENRQLSEGLLSFDLRHKQQLAKLSSLLSDCVDTGAELTDCLEETPVTAQLDAIRIFNFSTCRRLTGLPANGGQTLSPGYCSTSSSR